MALINHGLPIIPIHLIDSMTLSSPPVAGVWWAHTLDWFYDSLSSPPVAGERIHLIGSMTLSPLHL